MTKPDPKPADVNNLTSPIDDGTTPEDLGRVLLIGVGGVGMNGLTRLYATRGIDTVGTELTDWPNLPELVDLGVTLHRTHQTSNLDGIDTVVRSTAINDQHLEIVEAKKRGLRIMHRSEALAAAMTGRTSIVITGTHGKTTTTAITNAVLTHAGLDPSYVNGGEIIGAHTGAHGTGQYFVAEADESDRSFLRYRPNVGIITNIDLDHMNTYGTMDALVEACEQFCYNTVKDGVLVLCQDNEGTAAMAVKMREAGRNVITYGLSPEADVSLSELESSTDGVTFTVTHNGKALGKARLPMPGKHIAGNSGAAIATALYLGLEFDQIVDGLASFQGVKRRFENRGKNASGVHVYDEYAYHPTAMLEAIKTLKEVAAPGKLVVIFQPYRVYRTVEFKTEIAECLAMAAGVVVTEIFAPGEEIPADKGGQVLTDSIKLPENAKRFVANWDDIPAAAMELADEGDLVVTMGAPPISLMPQKLLDFK